MKIRNRKGHPKWPGNHSTTHARFGAAGGRATVKRYGKKHMVKIGKKGGRATAREVSRARTAR